jgi:hypothetical protein
MKEAMRLPSRDTIRYWRPKETWLTVWSMLPTTQIFRCSLYNPVTHVIGCTLITTADNVLLTPDAVSEFERQALLQRADAAAAFARKADILAARPDGQRRFYEFADGGYSNCNCYRIGNAKALAAAETFRGGGGFAKNPMRIVQAFGF